VSAGTPSASRQAATLELRHVSKTYPGAAEPAIRDLSLKVEAGEICVLVGPSGCGKTTAMRLVNRMIELTSGDILLDGSSVLQRRPAQLRREIGYAIQQIGLFPHRTVADNIATVPKLLGWDRRRIAARVEELIDLIGLPQDVARRYPAQLSGGQQQRVGVARALATDPPLMLMDEPFGAIDPISRERLQNEFLRLQARLRKTVVFVTHDIDEAIKMGDKVAVLREGGVLAQYASPAELLAAPADDFVASFVGADRALKRLALQRVRDIDLWKAVTCRAGESSADVRGRLARADVPLAILVDDEGRPLAWVSEQQLESAPTVAAAAAGARDGLVTVELDDILRDALSDLLAAESRYGIVVDEAGRVHNALSLDMISQVINSDPSEVPSTAELMALSPEPAQARVPGDAG
jgi:osmoprotectant transport system ATP-binding protein